METAVEKLLGDRAQARAFVGELVHYIGSTAGTQSKIRAALICASPRTGITKKFSTIRTDFQALFGKIETSLNSEHNAQRWILDQNSPSNPNFWAYAALLVVHYLERDHAALAVREGMRDILEADTFFQRLRDSVGQTDVSRIINGRPEIPDSVSLDTLRAIERESDPNHIAGRLLDHTSNKKQDEQEISYYSVFRYSTKKDEIVKTFLAILGPSSSAESRYSFVLVYGGGRERQKRITRGPIYSFGGGMYFLGASANETFGNRGITRGLKLMAIPSGSVNPDHFLMTGVFLSHARGWQPIVGRLSMIHLGYKSRLGRELTDEVGVYQIKDQDEFFEDLKCLDKQFDISTRYGKGLEQLRDEMLNTINNFTQVDRTAGVVAGLTRSIPAEDGKEPAD